MNQCCDLHTHSTYSDGTWTPTELIREAERLGLRAVALCDHNTVAGLPEFLDAARGTSVDAVPGIEFSTEYLGIELHILALFVAPERFGQVIDLVAGMMERKEQSNINLIHALGAVGIELDYDAIKAGTPGGVVNRAVIAAEMVRLGYCDSVKEAFQKWLSPKCGYYHPARRLDAFDTIRFIRSIGAVSVLAHPFLNLDEEGLRIFLEQAAPCGLNAMETCYATYTREQTDLAHSIAREFGLLNSGGSDFHADNKPDIQMGCGRGQLSVPAAFYMQLRELAKTAV